jgi:adenylyltransferase/sulfurtransferase
MSVIQDFLHYNRQMMVPKWLIWGRANSKKILVIGAGGLGCPILQYSNSWYGTIGIVDLIQ